MNRKHSLLVTGYWIVTLLANWVGYIHIHTIRHWLYRNIYRVKLPKSSIIYCNCRFFMPWKIRLGENSIIGASSFLDARKNIHIGNNVNITGEARIFTLQHDTTSPTFEAKGGPVKIEDWVYIGTRVIILPNVTIKEGSVVASGAVVTKDVKAWTMVGGVPAKYIKNRPIVKYTLDTKNRGLFV
jgi:acetyltransferase-like isoleucine patch superfamily enzyme